MTVMVVALALAGCTQPKPATQASPAARPSPTSNPTPALAASPRSSTTSTPVPVYVSAAGRPNEPTVLTQTVHGRRVYTIRALAFKGDIGGGPQAGTATLEQPHVTFVDKSGTTTIADAPKATVTQRDKSVLMTGGVHATTSDGSNLTCDTLRYDGESEHFHGTGHVVLRGRSGLALSGNYLVGDVRLRDVEVTKDRPR
jgi:LPS export ABC transporter protein LptC